jgi:signal transduction histidine kinase
MVERATPPKGSPLSHRGRACAFSLVTMRESVRQAARATVYLGLAVTLAFGSYLFITVLLITIVGTMAVVGAGLLPETVLLIRRMAGAKRRHVAAWTGREIPEAYRPITGGLRESLRTAVRDPGTYGDLRWMIAYYGYGALGYLALPLWPAGLVVDGVWCGLLGREAVVLPLISRLADLDAAWSAALLRPSPQALLAARVQELTRTRADAIAAHSAELRRIERDLHDGAQARLVSLSMRIGLARRAYASDPDAGRKLLDDAQDQAEQALTELRNVVRGIHPPVLSDRGLAGAVRALAAGSGLGVTVQVDGLEDGPRAPAAIEAAAYFVVAEALTNAAKHSGAARAEVQLTRTGAGLRVRVRDEGRGGADSAPADAAGSGLSGMRRRVAALDGTMMVTSPAGGPTVIEAELPCEW